MLALPYLVYSFPILEKDSPDSLANDVIPKRVGPADDFAMIMMWLATCHIMHPECRPETSTSEGSLIGEYVNLPTRVINVGSMESGQDPFLFETNGLKGVYLTLSHCWGKARVTVTEKSTLDAHKKRIPLESLPQNFRDAILVTRKLGYQYLWIDSLCIMQDSAEDWEIESSSMAQIYNNSTITLCAANSAAADEGFLKPRLPLEQRSTKLPHRDRTGSLDGYYYITEPLSNFNEDVEQGPLNKRGWTLQERVLSRRNVFFGKDQLHWECQTARLSENTGPLLRQKFIGPLSGISALRGLSVLPTTDVSSLYKLWYLIVAEFTKRSLTKGDDVLPALSGIASVFSTALNAKGSNAYAAGLWTQDLTQGLLWKSFGRLPEHQRKIRAPSWSWTSHDGRIQLAREMDPCIVDIRDLSFIPRLSGKDKHGRVGGGTITFTGYIKAVPSVTRMGSDYQDESGQQLYVFTNGLLWDEFGQQIGAADLDEPNSPLPETIYCVPLRHQEGGTPASIRSIEGLLLQKVEGQMVFRRIGTVTMKSNRNDARAKGAPFAEPYQVFFYNASKERISII
jgi:hypothetical protein